MHFDVFSPLIKRPPNVRISSYHGSSVVASASLCTESSFWVITDQLGWILWLVNSGTGEPFACQSCVLFWAWKAVCVITRYTKFHCIYTELITLIYNRNFSIIISQKAVPVFPKERFVER